MIRPRLMVAFALFLISVFLAVPYAFLQWGIAAKDFKQLAEAKAGEFLKAKVEIGKIRLRFPNRVVLSDLKLSREAGGAGPGPSRLEINQMAFRYHFAQLFSRNLKSPASVMLNAPKMTLSASGSPYSFFQSFDLAGTNSNRNLMTLEFNGGEIQTRIPGFASDILFSNIRGRISPDGKGKMHVDLRSDLQGAVNGKIRMTGNMDPARREQRLELRLEALTGSWGGPINGNARWEDDTIWLDPLRAKVYGWDSELRGSLKDLSKGGEVNLDFDMGPKTRHARFSLKGSFKTSDLLAGLQVPGIGNYQLSGKMVRDGAQVLFPELKLNTGYRGNGKVDFSSGGIRFLFEKEKQRILTEFNLRKPGVQLNVRLDHLPAAGLDLVTTAAIQLMPLRPGFGSRTAKFQGEFKTDYFILEYIPFSDFKGNFEISPAGIRDFSASWGRSFDLNGELPFGRGARAAFTVKVNGFDLKGVKQFAAKPLPKALGGLLDGQLKIEGTLHHPEFTGKFTIKDGSIGKLEYDLGVLQFHGFPPYLPLEDSRILKGRTTLFLNGALDFRMQNMFRGIQLQTDDKLVIWKGLEMNTSESLGDLEIETSSPKLPVLNIKAGQGRLNPGIPEENQDSNDHYVAAGPKFKF